MAKTEVCPKCGHRYEVKYFDDHLTDEERRAIEFVDLYMWWERKLGISGHDLLNKVIELRDGYIWNQFPPGTYAEWGKQVDGKGSA